MEASRHHGADLAKWLGLALMVLDHAWHVVPAEWQDLYGWVRAPGRLAYPIFCAVIAIRGRLRKRRIKHVKPMALVAAV